MTKKAWIIFTVLCAAVLAGLVYLANSNKVNVSEVATSTVQSATAQNGNIADHTYGNIKSKVVIVEYADYQCPGCGSSYAIIKQVIDKYKDKIGFVFRNFPLYSIHPNAFAAAAAAEAAGKQGKYWEMHDKLYENQSAWNQLTGADRTDYFATTAISLGLNGDTLRADLDSADIKKKIEFDRALGLKDNVNGTPSFYIDGKSVASEYVKDGKIVPKGTDGANLVWSDAVAFETYVVKPALEAAGIK